MSERSYHGATSRSLNRTTSVVNLFHAEQNRTLFTIRPFCNGVRGIYIILSEQDGLQEDIYNNEYIKYFIDTCIEIVYVNIESLMSCHLLLNLLHELANMILCEALPSIISFLPTNVIHLVIYDNEFEILFIT